MTTTHTLHGDAVATATEDGAFEITLNGDPIGEARASRYVNPDGRTGLCYLVTAAVPVGGLTDLDQRIAISVLRARAHSLESAVRQLVTIASMVKVAGR